MTLFDEKQHAEFSKLLDMMKSVGNDMKALYRLDVEAELTVLLLELVQFLHRELPFSKFFFPIVAGQYVYMTSLPNPSSDDVDLMGSLEEMLISWRDKYAPDSEGYKYITEILEKKC